MRVSEECRFCFGDRFCRPVNAKIATRFDPERLVLHHNVVLCLRPEDSKQAEDGVKRGEPLFLVMNGSEYDITGAKLEEVVRELGGAQGGYALLLTLEQGQVVKEFNNGPSMQQVKAGVEKSKLRQLALSYGCIACCGEVRSSPDGRKIFCPLLDAENIKELSPEGVKAAKGCPIPSLVEQIEGGKLKQLSGEEVAKMRPAPALFKPVAPPPVASPLIASSLTPLTWSLPGGKVVSVPMLTVLINRLEEGTASEEELQDAEQLAQAFSQINSKSSAQKVAQEALAYALDKDAWEKEVDAKPVTPPLLKVSGLEESAQSLSQLAQGNYIYQVSENQEQAKVAGMEWGLTTPALKQTLGLFGIPPEAQPSLTGKPKPALPDLALTGGKRRIKFEEEE